MFARNGYVVMIALSFLFAWNTEAYNILGIFSMKAKSHWVIFSSLTNELARRGHNVDVYTVIPSKQSIPNYREFDISSCFHREQSFESIDIQMILNTDFIEQLKMIYDLLPRSSEVRNCAPIMELSNFPKKYDALIVDPFDTDFFSIFAHKCNATLINIFSNFLYNVLLNRMGSPSNPSYINDMEAEQPTSFSKKMYNVHLYVSRIIYNDFFAMPFTEKVREEAFGSNVPSVEDIVRNTSLILSNSHFSVNTPIPLVPGVVQVAGIHIKNSKKLPPNIEKFINESEHGVVYFCMGSLLRGETFPEEKRNAFLYAFSKIPQRVLWKWEGDVLPGKSDNIMISKWMPQRDILAHPNVKLFISHGGLLGTSEAVYEGVPVLGIPIFGDQRTNIKSLEANGAGELLDYNEISNDVVLEKIQRLLNDPKYKENAKQLSARYRDRPMSPLDTAVYWTEYVIRHKGAPHLRTAAADMPWYQYLLLDVIAFLIIVFISALAIIYYSIKFTFRFICNLICSKKSSSKPEKKVKRN